MKLNNFLKMAMVAALTFGATGAAKAIVAYNFPASLPSAQTGGPYSLGNMFTVSSAITLTGLGAFTPNGQFGGSGVDVAIYAITRSGTTITGGTLVSGAGVHFGGTYTTLAGTSTAMQNIAPQVLGAGTYMVVANHYGPGGSVVNYNPYWSEQVIGGGNLMSAANVSGVTFSGNGYYNPSGNLNFGSTLSSGWSYDPISVTLAGTGAPRYGAGNFEFTFAAVPESSTFAVAGVGMLGLVYFGRGISRRAKAK